MVWVGVTAVCLRQLLDWSAVGRSLAELKQNIQSRPTMVVARETATSARVWGGANLSVTG